MKEFDEGWEDKIRDRLSGYRPDFEDGDLKKSIFENIPSKKGRRVPYWPYLLGAAALLLIGVSYVFVPYGLEGISDMVGGQEEVDDGANGSNHGSPAFENPLQKGTEMSKVENGTQSGEEFASQTNVGTRKALHGLNASKDLDNENSSRATLKGKNFDNYNSNKDEQTSTYLAEGTNGVPGQNHERTNPQSGNVSNIGADNRQNTGKLFNSNNSVQNGLDKTAKENMANHVRPDINNVPVGGSQTIKLADGEEGNGPLAKSSGTHLVENANREDGATGNPVKNKNPHSDGVLPGYDAKDNGAKRANNNNEGEKDSLTPSLAIAGNTGQDNGNGVPGSKWGNTSNPTGNPGNGPGHTNSVHQKGAGPVNGQTGGNFVFRSEDNLNGLPLPDEVNYLMFGWEGYALFQPNIEMVDSPKMVVADNAPPTALKKDKKGEKEDKWEASIYFAPFYTFNNISVNVQDDYLFENITTREMFSSDRLGLKGTTEITYALSSRLKLYGGANYKSYKVYLDYQYIASGYGQFEKDLIDDFRVSLKSNAETEKGKINERISALGAQVGGYYQLFKNIPHHGVKFGLEYQYLFGAKMLYLEGKSYNYIDKKQVLVNAGYFMEYPMGKRFFFALSPHLNYAFNTDKREAKPLKLKPFSYGLDIGIKYKF